MATNKTSQSTFEEISLEYSHLRQEILHNGTLNSQTLAATLAIVGVLMGLAFSERVSNDAIRGVMFFLAAIIILINTLQILDRERATYVIASYIRVFIESKLSDLRWESRLKEFREESKKLGYGDFITSQIIINTIFVIVNTILGNIYLYNGLMNPVNARSNITSLAVALIVANSFTLCFIFHASKKYKMYANKHEVLYANVWEIVKNKKSPKPKRA